MILNYVRPSMNTIIYHALGLFVILVAAEDCLKPQFHFSPHENWMNDPNGPMVFNGIYHLFYQYDPYAAVWGDIHWYILYL